ncbi:MAG TPA: hypothetical protein VFY73_01905 [Ideonella sp.]|uniref:hypothetical protein n=1 Tax=Ideonella sp. TaxID=1929293 RepID=UPI002E31167B|nr:hypothetical protein [Ideonella sp.]HEX5682762.1 hypothetical protein [Ideonella sp.]
MTNRPQFPTRRQFVQAGAATLGSAALPHWGQAVEIPAQYRKPKSAAFDYRTDVGNGAFDAVALDLHARFSFSILGMLPSQAAPGAAGNVFVSRLKARNSNIKVGQYVILSQAVDESTGSEYAAIYGAVNAGGTDNKDWWARAGEASPVSPGAKTKSVGVKGYAAWEVNQTEFVKPDALGRRAPEAIADAYHQILLANLYAVGLDVVFNDNVWGNPGSQSSTGSDGVNDFPKGTVANYDLDKAGTNDASSNADLALGVSPAYRRGYKRFIARLKALKPGIECMANADFDSTTPTFVSCLTTKELSKKYEYGLLEALTSKNYSIDTWRGNFADTMACYRSQRAGVTKAVFVGAYLDTAVDPLTRTLQKARYGLGVSMLDDGYAVIGDTPAGADVRPYWFDELDAPIGDAIEPGPTAPWSNGMWRRNYRNGCIVVNPSCNNGRWMGNAPGTLTLTRSMNVVTLFWSDMPEHGKKPGSLIRIQDCTTDATFNGTFTIGAVDDAAKTISWSQAGEDRALNMPTGFWGVQTTVDLRGQGYRRLLGVDDAHDNYDGGTSQNDGSLVRRLTLWPNDAILLLRR